MSAQELVTAETPGPLITREQIEAEARYAEALAARAVAGSTRTAYASAWRGWEKYATARGLSPLPADPRAVALYIGVLVSEGRSVSTVEKTAAAIARVHRDAGLESPTRAAVVEAAIMGARRTLAGAPRRQARALSIAEVRMMSAACSATTVGRRDRALLLVGVALGLRSASLVGLESEDVQAVAEGCEVTLRTSKTDQVGAGVTLALARAPEALLCPVEALSGLLAAQQPGALFRSATRGGTLHDARLTPAGVTGALVRMARRAGVSTTRLTSHSLRASFVTLAYAAGVSEGEIARVSGHTSLSTMRGYDRSSRWAQPASAAIWGGGAR